MKTMIMLIAAMVVATMASETHPRYQQPHSVPAFLWSSSSSYMNKGHHQIKTTITSDSFAQALTALSSESPSSLSSDNELVQLTNRETYPEAVIMFVEAEMRTDLFAKHASNLPNLQKLINKAYTSVEVPYILAPAYTSILSPALSSSHFTLAHDESNKFVELGKGGNVVQLQINDLVEYLKTSDVFTNNKVDVIVVSFDWMSDADLSSDLSEHDQIIAKVAEVATKDTLFVYTADYAVPSKTVWTYAQQRTTVYMPRADSNNTIYNNSNMTHTINYFPGTFLEVLIVSAFLLAMVFSGGCALFGLQTPDRWEPPKQLKIKEI